MTGLELNFLGDLEVIRDGAVLPLPPSKKTRALLAYLALNDRSFRREQLCELLWEIPDDPRGSLRWSLSKLRRVVDEDDQPRIVADRTNVRLDGAGLTIDLLDLKQVLAGDLTATSIDTLEAHARRYRGNFLEGLELSNFHDFHAWCVGEREAAVKAQAVLLAHLIERLIADPERALPYARSLVGVSPYDETARATLIRLLVVLQRNDEAEQQVRLGERMLAEIGAESDGSLFAAWRGTPGQKDAAEVPEPAPPATAVEAAPLAVESRALIGREVECAQLKRVFDGVVGDLGGRVVLLSGEPGIGKSRLLEWVASLARSTDALLLESSAFESEAIRPYALWIDALRRRGLAAAVFDDADRDNRDRLFGGLSDFVMQHAAEQPVVVLFDDVQWSDESSMAALHYVARMCRRTPVCFVLAGRDGELQDNAALQLALRGLRRDGMLEDLKVGALGERAIRELIAEHAPDADSGGVSRECGGNPLLAIELARAGSGDAGGSLDELVQDRLGRFDVDAAEVMRWAAVLSPRINLPVLVQISTQDSNQVGAALELAERQGMLRPSQHGFRFSHDLISRGVYAQIAPARRQVMHRRVAELIEQDTALDLEHGADLAHHAMQSGDPGLGARALVSAGKLCLRFFANDDALVLARKGLQIATQLGGAEQVCRRIELFDVMLTAAPVYEWEAAAQEYAALAEQALNHGELGHARLGYHMSSTVRWMNGNWAGAREESLQAELVARGASEEEHVLGMAETAKCLALLERDLSQADAMLMEARAIAIKNRLNFPALPTAEGILRYHANELDQAEALLKEARMLCKSAGDRVSEYQASEYLVMIELERGRFDQARQRTQILLELGERLREGSEAPFARALDGLCRYAEEDDAALMIEALEELRIVDAKHRLAYVLNRAAELDLQRGRLQDASDRAAEALQCSSVLERNTEMLLAHGVLYGVSRANNDDPGMADRRLLIERLAASPIAPWARRRVAGHMGAGADIEEKDIEEKQI